MIFPVDSRALFLGKACNCAAAKKRCSSLHRIRGGNAHSRSMTRRNVSRNKVWPPKSMNCLGYSLRESGHSRVPVPPHRDDGAYVH